MDDCYGPRCPIGSYTPNADVRGVGVVVANIVTTICLRILITWSPNVDTGIQTSLFQTHSVLISTLVSISTRQLADWDIEYALSLCLSPLMVYLIVASFCDIFGMKTGLYARIESYRRTVRAFAILVPLLWLVLNTTVAVLIQLDRNANPDNPSWRDVFFGDILSSLYWSEGIPSYLVFGSLFALCLFRRRFQLLMDVRTDLGRTSGLRRKLRAPWVLVNCAWRTMECHHKWWIHALFAYFDITWTIAIVYYTVPVFSYGQALTILSVIPILISTAELIHSRHKDLIRFLRRFPRLFLAEVRYLIGGVEPRPPEESQQPEDVPSTTPVPLTVVHDIILALLSDRKIIESLELICATHKLNSPITDSIMRVARENPLPVCENQSLPTALTDVVSTNTPPQTRTYGDDPYMEKDIGAGQEK